MSVEGTVPCFSDPTIKAGTLFLKEKMMSVMFVMV